MAQVGLAEIKATGPRRRDFILEEDSPVISVEGFD